MSEYVTLGLKEGESLICDVCQTRLKEQEVQVRVDNGSVTEVLCASCAQITRKEKKTWVDWNIR